MEIIGKLPHLSLKENQNWAFGLPSFTVFSNLWWRLQFLHSLSIYKNKSFYDCGYYKSWSAPLHELVLYFSGNGVIDFIEFLQMMAKMASDIDETIKEAFYIFDSDGSGAISSEEFREVMVTQGRIFLFFSKFLKVYSFFPKFNRNFSTFYIILIVSILTFFYGFPKNVSHQLWKRVWIFLSMPTLY